MRYPVLSLLFLALCATSSLAEDQAGNGLQPASRGAVHGGGDRTLARHTRDLWQKGQTCMKKIGKFATWLFTEDIEIGVDKDEQFFKDLEDAGRGETKPARKSTLTSEELSVLRGKSEWITKPSPVREKQSHGSGEVNGEENEQEESLTKIPEGGVDEKTWEQLDDKANVIMRLRETLESREQELLRFVVNPHPKLGLKKTAEKIAKDAHLPYDEKTGKYEHLLEYVIATQPDTQIRNAAWKAYNEIKILRQELLHYKKSFEKKMREVDGSIEVFF